MNAGEVIDRGDKAKTKDREGKPKSREKPMYFTKHAEKEGESRPLFIFYTCAHIAYAFS